MLPGVVPFPPEFAARYRAKGYWRYQSLAQAFDVVFERYADRVAIIDGETVLTYAEVDRLSTNLALNLWALGMRPLDRVIPTLPNVHEFVILYFALQKIGAIPIAALVTHRFAEINQFAELSGAIACVYPDRVGDFEFAPIINRVQQAHPALRLRLVLGTPQADELSLRTLIDRPAALPADILTSVTIDPTDPCIFQLSGGTTGIPKLIPRTHNDYAFNSREAARVTDLNSDTVLLLVLPIAHNLPLACPGIQGVFFHGGKVVLHGNTRPEAMFALIERHGVTHLKVVPALLIRLINDPSAAHFNLSSLKLIQSGGQRMQPEVRQKTRALIPGVFVQENFGMSEGTLMFVCASDSEVVKLETCGRPVCEDDEVLLLDDDDHPVPDGEVGELTVRGPYTLRGYFGVPEYNARQFTGWVLPIRRPDAPPPFRQLCGGGPQKRLDQPGRGKDQCVGNREPDPHARGRSERGHRADARPEHGREDVCLRDPQGECPAGSQNPGWLSDGQGNRQVQTARTVGGGWRVSRIHLWQGLQEGLGRTHRPATAT